MGREPSRTSALLVALRRTDQAMRFEPPFLQSTAEPGRSLLRGLLSEARPVCRCRDLLLGSLLAFARRTQVDGVGHARHLGPTIRSGRTISSNSSAVTKPSATAS